MYSRNGSVRIALAATAYPSLLPNNLSIADGMLAYIKGSDVIVSSTSGNSHIVAEVTRSNVYCAQLVKCNRNNFLCIGSAGGIQVWCGNGVDMKYFASLSTLMENVETVNLENHYIQCVSGCGSNHIVAGGSNGVLYVLDVPQGDGEGISIIHKLDTSGLSSHRNCGPNITAVYGLGSDHVVCANEGCDIYGYDRTSAYQLTCRLPGSLVKNNTGSLITSLLTRANTVIAGYTSGHIRIFRMSVQELAIEISAHYRSISALSLHPTAPLFASCAEDQYAYVWGFPDFTSKHAAEADLIHREYIENKKCTGITFFSHQSTSADQVAIVNYDDEEVVVLSRD